MDVGFASVSELAVVKTAPTRAARPQASLLSRSLREPLVHFLALGAALLLLSTWWQASHEPNRIVVDAPTIQRISAGYTQQYGAPPTANVLDELIGRFVEEEVLYRKGIALGVDRSDEVIRRRVVHKMRFLTEDAIAVGAPNEEAMRAFYEQEQTRYRMPQLQSFTHVYFSSDQGGDAQARERAIAARRALDPSVLRAPERGDAFLGLYDYARADTENLERLFGRSQIVDAIQTAPVGQWLGPFRSAFGWHLVRVHERSAAGRLAFNEVHEQVKQDLMSTTRERQNAAALQKLKSDFVITISTDRGR
jgi:hypothetical protein